MVKVWYLFVVCCFVVMGFNASFVTCFVCFVLACIVADMLGFGLMFSLWITHFEECFECVSLVW